MPKRVSLNIYIYIYILGGEGKTCGGKCKEVSWVLDKINVWATRIASTKEGGTSLFRVALTSTNNSYCNNKLLLLWRVVRRRLV